MKYHIYLRSNEIRCYGLTAALEFERGYNLSPLLRSCSYIIFRCDIIKPCYHTRHSTYRYGIMLCVREDGRLRVTSIAVANGM